MDYFFVEMIYQQSSSAKISEIFLSWSCLFFNYKHILTKKVQIFRFGVKKIKSSKTSILLLTLYNITTSIIPYIE